jgi:hypothetical protein
MKPTFLQYFGMSLLMSCSVTTIILLLAWFIYPVITTQMEILIMFFGLLATIGYFAYKYGYADPNPLEKEICPK